MLKLVNGLLGFALFFLSTAVPGWAQSGWQPVQEAIHKNSQDHRHYQAIRLDNGMTVLLVSDKEAVKSLAAVAAPVGSLENPHNQLGLAHYLEHMILMGSRHYPEPENFSEFLKKHGGDYNASTASYRTAFYLEVENDALQHFYKRYYSANLMVAVIYSNQPLPDMAKLAAATFGHIANHRASVPPITVPAVTAAQTGIVIHYQPVQLRKIMTPVQIARWRHLERAITLSLPALNPYIANDVSLIRSANHPEHPETLLDEPGLRLHSMPSRAFANEPRADITLNFRNAAAMGSARNQVLYSLNDYLSNLELAELSNQAYVGGISFSSYVNNGLTIKASGYTQRLVPLVIAQLDRYLAIW